MEPLKRFTQCGSLTMLFSIFIVLFGVSSTALTTFGKTNPNQLQQPTPPPAKGRECNTHSDCATLQSTSCVKDPNDGRTRCLCGDNVAPVNGQCFARAKALGHLCLKDADCEEGMVCSIDNSTKLSSTTKMHISNAYSPMRICFCDVENGYKEYPDYTCSKGVLQTFTNYSLLLGCIVLLHFTSSSLLSQSNRNHINVKCIS